MSQTNERTFTIRQEWRDDDPYVHVTDADANQTFIFRITMDRDTTYASPSTMGSNADDLNGLRDACAHLERNGYAIHLDGLQPAGFSY